MKISKEIIFCEVLNKRFTTIKFHFDYSEDFILINKFIDDGWALAKKLNPVLARDGTRKRDFENIITNAIAGIISEYVWRYWLNLQNDTEKTKLVFRQTELKDIKNQIDIEILYPNKSNKFIEVRSSFPYTGIKNGICKVFDIIGWYANQVKLMETKKDFYLRALFPYKVYDFRNILKKSFDVFLTGGADKQMLESSKYAKYKEFVPFDEFSEKNIKATKYRVVEPIINADDCVAIVDKIYAGEG